MFTKKFKISTTFPIDIDKFMKEPYVSQYCTSCNVEIYSDAGFDTVYLFTIECKTETDADDFMIRTAKSLDTWQYWR